MELELKQIKSFNREVYESRVRQRYLEERVTRALYTQKQAMRRHEMRASQVRRQAERLRWEQGMRTPFHVKKAADARAQALHTEMRNAGAPVFSDIANIEARLKAANLRARGVGEGSSVAKPATPHELALREMRNVPPSESLLNPRNQMTSPLPDKKTLMPYASPKKSKASAGASAAANALGAKAALKLLPDLFDAKRRADWEAERAGAPRPNMLTAARGFLTEKLGSEARAREKLVALRYACALHAHRPRVALFQGMAGWDSQGTPWDATKASAALLLMMWLQPPPDEALKVSKRFIATEEDFDMPDVELKLSDVELVLSHLKRKQLVSAKGVAVLREEAKTMVLAQLPPPAPQRDEPAVAVDELLVHWMSIWGNWSWSEDTAVLSSVVSAFSGGKRSPAKSPWPAKGMSPLF